MADAPEIPEATDPFEKRVAISIAVLAVILSLVSNLGDNAKTDAILKTNKSTDQWAFFQSASLKKHLAVLEGDLLEELAPAPGAANPAKKIARLREDAAKYESGQNDIKKEAERLKGEAEQDEKVNDACDLSSLLLQIGVVICSVAILSHWKAFWYAGLALGAAGTVWGVHAFLM
jgi:hypothetical protein